MTTPSNYNPNRCRRNKESRQPNDLDLRHDDQHLALPVVHILSQIMSPFPTITGRQADCS